MKNLLILFLLYIGHGTLLGQEKRLSKEETVQYIKDQLINGNAVFSSLMQSEYVDELSINGCDMSIKFRLVYDDEQDDKITVMTIPLINTDKIEKSIIKDKDGQTTAYCVVFQSYKRNNSFFLDLDNDLHGEDEVKEARDIDGLIKALNYLRKLCGAPDSYYN